MHNGAHTHSHTHMTQVRLTDLSSLILVPPVPMMVPMNGCGMRT